VPEPNPSLSEAVDRVARHELERRLERLSGEMLKLRRTLAPLARFRTIIDQAGEAVLVLDTETRRFVDANETALKWLGLSRKRLLSLTADDVRVEFSLEYRETRADHVTDTRSADRPWVHSQGIHRRRDGSWFPVEVAVALRRFADRTYTLVVARESKRRHQAETALREAEEKYQALFDLTADAIYLTTRDGSIAQANQTAIEKFGYTREKFIGLQAHLLYSKASDIREFQETVEEEGFVRNRPIEFRAHDGSVFTGLLTATLRHSGEGLIDGYQCLIRFESADLDESSMRGEAYWRDASRRVAPLPQPVEPPAIEEHRQAPDPVQDHAAVVEGLQHPATPESADQVEESDADIVVSRLIGSVYGYEIREVDQSEEDEAEAEADVPQPVVEPEGMAELERESTEQAAEPEQMAVVAESTPKAVTGQATEAPPADPVDGIQRSAEVEEPELEAARQNLSDVVESVAQVSLRSMQREAPPVRFERRFDRDAPWETKPAQPPRVAAKRRFNRWPLFTIGALLSAWGWSEILNQTFPYVTGQEAWQLAVRGLGLAVLVLAVAGRSGKRAAKGVAVVAFAVGLVLFVTYLSYVYNFQAGLRGLVPDAELALRDAVRRATEFTTVTVLACIAIGRYLWRMDRTA
jgi:PAS domain S-box-containing protein